MIDQKTLQKAVRAAARRCADEVEAKLVPVEGNANPAVILQFRYGRQEERGDDAIGDPVKCLLRGDTEKEQLRDLCVRVEAFMGAR